MLNIFHKLHHVCIVVHDIQKSMAYYESVGIGPWYSWGSFSEFTELDVEDVEAQNETTSIIFRSNFVNRVFEKHRNGNSSMSMARVSFIWVLLWMMLIRVKPLDAMQV
jgi:hypothetical protein